MILYSCWQRRAGNLSSIVRWKMRWIVCCCRACIAGPGAAPAVMDMPSPCSRMLDRDSELAALRAFARNLRPLLLTPPMRGAVVLGIDPGFRHGRVAHGDHRRLIRRRRLQDGGD